ncbi:hypothetical protein AWB90_22935 [Mycobacterium paraense]|uniref:FAD-binding domain-containing protein n=1 Tax=Mycobacterium paraense TaxID=767916 RepID=A0A1X2A5L8_9MYCO|nr:FAD-dependent monooxygenase [Mycobacterium paraense]ORW40779.1 hypothetical protein AWB90_22935 [Mycobacterium paraense]
MGRSGFNDPAAFAVSNERIGVNAQPRRRASEHEGAEILIVGAGPTGLVLAAELARSGVIPRVIDAGKAEVKESRAVAVAARSLELLDDLGIAAAALQRGIPLRRLNFHQDSTALAELDLTALDSPFPIDLVLPQWQTVELLRDKVEKLGVEVEWETRLASFRPDDGVVTAEIVHPGGRSERFSTGWLIGCDGAHSTVRTAAGIGWETADLRRNFILGDVAADWDIPRDCFHVWFAKTGLVAVFPMPGGYWRIITNAADDHPPGRPGLIDFAANVGERTPLDPRLRDLQWSSAFVAREGLAMQFRSGRVLLAGDAAHSHSPIGGQGMNTGMQDAYNLGWKLALVVADRRDPRLLDSYQSERRPVASSVINATSTATRVATGNALVARRVRRHALRLFGELNTAQQKFSNALGEHLVNYRNSALVYEHWVNAKPRPWSDSETGPEAGEVVRDGYVETASGPVALRHLFRALGHHLLLFAAHESRPDALTEWKLHAEQVMAGNGQVHVITRCHVASGSTPGVYADLRSDVHNRYGVRRPSLYLIRPDKYVGYRNDAMDFDRVRDYFHRLDT